MAVSERSGVASAALAAEVRDKVRQRGIVLWVDAERQYPGLVDALGKKELGFEYPVVSYRGSYLELMLALEPYGNGLHREHVLVHLPGLNKDTVKETPVYELYEAGTVFEKNLATLVREAAVGVARPDEIDAFVRAPGLTLAGADAWIAASRREPRDRLELLLESLGLEDVVLGFIGDDPRLREHLPAGGEAILGFLERGLGLGASWRAFVVGDAALSPGAVATLVASWLMAVEFVHDLKEPAVTPELAALAKLGPLEKVCRKLAARVRDVHPDSYELFETELVRLLGREQKHHARVLGSIDTFRFEEAAVRAAAFDALRSGDSAAALAFAVERTPESCFWVRRSTNLQRTWEIVKKAAETGLLFAQTIDALERCASLEEATAQYVKKLAPVDRAMRLFEQRAHAVLASDLADYDALLEVRGVVRRAHRAWVDATNRKFFELCVAHGALPPRSLRQRAVYDDVVHPLTEQGGRVAFFMVDALRFEMAQALADKLSKDKSFRVKLTPRLAELPTETVIGMNALAPVERGGKLRLVTKEGTLAGFASNALTVREPKDRVRAMSDRSLQGRAAEDIELEAFQDMSLAALKKRLAGKPSLVVVRSRELDTAGENGLHLGTFEQTLTLLESALSLLSQAGVERFVVASDHGFLLQDATTANLKLGASMRVPERRYALLDGPSGEPDVLELRLSMLDYEVAEDLYLVLRPDTALWQTKKQVAPFVHGGNSMQERVIPVLELERAVKRGKTTSRYEIVARAEPSHLGRQRLKIAVRLQERETASLGFLAPKTIALALRIPGRTDVRIRILDAGPPAQQSEGRVLVPPNRDEALVEFELEGAVDEKVRVEVYHPDAIEDVTPKEVEGFFDVARDRRLGKQEETPPQPDVPGADQWAGLVEDEGYVRVLQIIAERRSINETELVDVLGSPRRVRAFARSFDALVTRLPFEVEVLTVNGMKAYARKG